MAEPTNPTAPAPAPAPSQAPTPAPAPDNKAGGSASSTISAGAPKTEPNKSPIPPDGATAPTTRDAANEARSGHPIRRANVITNPPPARDPDAPVPQPVREAERAVPQATIDEMEAGKKALERNKPVASALEKAREEKSGTVTTPETNPVDATNELQRRGEV